MTGIFTCKVLITEEGKSKPAKVRECGAKVGEYGGTDNRAGKESSLGVHIPHGF